MPFILEEGAAILSPRLRRLLGYLWQEGKQLQADVEP
jgi:hypothetical protein